MIKTITEWDFVNSFDQANRSENFSVAGRKALFNWFTELEEDCGMESQMELDPIAVCCEFSEYGDITELKEDYPVPEDCEDDDEALEHFREETLVIELDNGGLIIQQY
jgi:hypothetical protein